MLKLRNKFFGKSPQVPDSSVPWVPYDQGSVNTPPAAGPSHTSSILCQKCEENLDGVGGVSNREGGVYLHDECDKCDECQKSVRKHKKSPQGQWTTIKREGSLAKRGPDPCHNPVPKQSRMLILHEKCRVVLAAREQYTCYRCTGAMVVPRSEFVAKFEKHFHLECFYCIRCGTYFPNESLHASKRDNILLMPHERARNGTLTCSKEDHSLYGGNIPWHSGVNMGPDMITSGGSCSIYKGCLSDGTQVALRTPTDPERDRVMEKFKRQTVLWWNVARGHHEEGHANLVRLLGYWQKGSKLYAVFPWASNGTISEYVRAHQVVDKVGLLCGIADGLAHLHSQTVVHGDISPKNILIDQNGTPMLCDPDLLKFLEGYTTTMSTGGVERLRAPELKEGQSKTEATDIYALGATGQEVLAGCPEAKYGPTPVLPEPIPTSLTNAEEMAWDCFTKCREIQPNDRPKMEVVLHRLRQAWQCNTTPPAI